MPTLDERVSFLEGRLAEQSTILQSIQQAIASLDGRIQQGLSSLDGRLSSLDGRVRQDISSLDGRTQQSIAGLDQRIRDIDTKMSSQFHWLVGLFVGTFLTTMLGFAGIVVTLLQR